jgi:hypothetical protein
LALAESALAVGLVHELVHEQIAALSVVPAPLRVLAVMMLVVGLFGGLLVSTRRFIKRGVERTHDAAKRLPVPATAVLAHGLLLLLLFLGYAAELGLLTDVMDYLRASTGPVSVF